MTERAQALEAIRERLKNFETVKHAMDRIGNTPLATTRYVEDVTTLLDLLAVPPPPPVGSPTTERPTKPSREVPNLMKALLKSLEPPVVEPTPEPLTEKPPHYCVWRETPTSTMWPSCVGQIDPLPGYRFCPYCGHPLTVER